MIQSIPLNKLVASPRNVRRHSDSAADAELKASIAAHGLLQKLIVRAGAKGKFEVEAGERRRKAMLALVDAKHLPRVGRERWRDRQVPVGGMANPGAGSAGLRLPKRKTGSARRRQADKDMLRENSLGEWDDHPGELVDGPKTDEFRIIETLGNDVPVGHGGAALLFGCQLVR